MTEPFLDSLATRVLVCDGATGTQFYAKGIFLNRCFDELNLTQPGLVAAVHRDYVRAGADVIETNTWGANRFKLTNFGLADQASIFARRGAEIARQAAANAAWVAGSIGPLGVRIEPWGKTGIDEAEAAFREQALALVEGGVDLFILETFGDLNEILAAIRAVRSVSELPIVAQMTTEEGGLHTPDGSPAETFAPALERAGANVLGVNCSVGPAAMLETIEAMGRVTTLPLSAQPNAGRPRDVDGRNIYLCSPEYMASYARRFAAAGVRLVGGCCGTTPEHVRQMSIAVRAATPTAVRTIVTVSTDGATETAPPAERHEKSALARAFADRKFAVVMDVPAPRGLDLHAAVGQARRFRDLGAIAVNVPDYPKSGARASAMALGVLVEQQGPVETLLHFTCRDRSLIGMQSDLVGAHAMGLRNVLLTTGTPGPILAQAGYADATSVFDIDAIGLTNMVERLNHGLDVAGQSIGMPTRFHIGVAVNPFAPDPDAEWRRLEHKVEAGAEFLVTPPIFDVEAFDAVLPRLRGTGLPILAGVAALEGVRHAEFFASEVVGVRLPDRLIEGLRRAGDERAAALALMVEIARALTSRVDGLQITSLHGSSQTAEALLVALRPRLVRAERFTGTDNG